MLPLAWLDARSDGYSLIVKRNSDGKVVLEKTFPPDTPLDKACQDFNDSIAVWRKSSKAERMKERAEKNNKAAKDSEHSAAT